MWRVNRIVVALSLLLGVAVGGTAVAAQDLAQPLYDTEAPQECRAGMGCAQVFTLPAGTDGLVVREVILPLSREGMSDLLRVEVRDVVGNKPGGELYAYAELTPDAVRLKEGYADPGKTRIELTPVPGMRMVAGKEYALVLTVVPGGKSGSVGLQGQGDTTYYWYDYKKDVYAPGRIVLEATKGGLWQAYPDMDFAFEMVLDEAPEQPTIQNPGPQTVDEGRSTAVTLVVTHPESITKLTAESEDPNLLTVQVEQVGQTWQLVLTASDVVTADTEVQVTIRAEYGGESPLEVPFPVTVRNLNDAPVIKFLNIPAPPDEAKVLEDAPLDLRFEVTDEETGPEGLTVTVTPVNTDLFIGGVMNPTSEGLVALDQHLQLKKDAFGKTEVLIEASDGQATETAKFNLNVLPQQDPPEFVELPGDTVTTKEDTPVTVQVVAYDPDLTDPLTLDAVSSNPGLLPSKPDAGGYGIKIIKTDTSNGRTTWQVTLNPSPDESGTATVTLYLDDGRHYVRHSFQLNVEAVNDQPRIEQVDTVVRKYGSGPFAVDLQVSDVETVVTQLGVNATIIRNDDGILSAVEVRRQGTQWQIWVTPTANMTGTATIEVTVDDKSNTPNSTATMTFDVVIEREPVIQGLPPSDSMVEEQPKDFHFTVDWADQVTATTSAPELVRAEVVPSGTGWKLTVTPEVDVVGTFTVTVTASNQYFSAAHTMTVSIANINDPPVIELSEKRVETLEDKPATVDLIIRDPDPNDSHDVIIELISGSPAVAEVKAYGQGLHRTLRITPVSELSGESTFRVTVRDKAGAQASETLEVVVINVDDPPIIFLPESPSIDEDTPEVRYTIRVVDPDTPGPYSLSVLWTDVPIEWGAIDAEAGLWELIVKPKENQSGYVTIRFKAESGGLATVADLRIFIREINDPPSLWFDEARIEIDEDTFYILQLTIDDPETPLQNLRVSFASDNQKLLPPSSFRYQVDGDSASVMITPAPDQYGQALVTVSVSDGFLSDQKTLEVIVHPTPDDPRLENIPDPIVIDEDGRFDQQVRVYDPDVPGGPVAVQISVSGAIFGCQPGADCPAVRLDPSGEYRRLVIEPVENMSGTGTITFHLSVDDGQGHVRQATREVAVTVRPVNDPPFIQEIPDQEILEDGMLSGVTVLIGDIDSNVNELRVEAFSSNTSILRNDLIRIEPEFSTDNGFGAWLSAIPEPDRFGTVTVTVRVTDPEGATANRSFRLNILPVNDPPTFETGPDIVVPEDAGPQSFPKWAKDISPGPFEQGQKVTFELEIVEEHTAYPQLFAEGPAIAPDGTLTFTPAPNAHGSALVRVWLKDDGGTEHGGKDTSDPPKTFAITVNSVNDVPVISPIPNYGTDVGTATGWIRFDVHDEETPEDQLAEMITIEVTSSDTGLVPNGNIDLRWEDQPEIRLTPVDGKTGVTTITITATDSDGGVGKTSFLLYVNNLALRGLEPSIGTLNPPFDPRILSYVVPYEGWVPQVQVTAYVDDPAVRIRVEGEDVASGQKSQPIRLGENGGEVRVEVYSPLPDVSISRTYTLSFVRQQSAVAELADLSITPGELQPKFDPKRYHYTATVPHEVTAVTVNARPGDVWTKVTVDGHQNLRVGTNRIVVTVTAETGERVQYFIDVTRLPGPLNIRNVEVEAGADWATLKFALDDAASVTLYYRPEDGVERSRSGGYGSSHTITLTGLEPATAYTYRIHAERSMGTGAELVSSFRTAAPEARGLCEVGADGSLSCPTTSSAVTQARQVLPDADPNRIAVAAATDRDMGAAVAEILAAEVPEGERVVTLRLDDLPHGVALLDEAALRRAAGLGVAVKVESPRGSVTLTPSFLAELQLNPGEQLAVALTPGAIDSRYLEPWLSTGGYRQVGEPLAVSLVRISERGMAPVSTLPSPLLVSHPALTADEVEAATMAVFAQVSGRTQLEPLGGRLTADRTRIEAAQPVPGSTVVLAYDHRFSDVPPSHWAYRIVHEMAARQVLRGVTPTQFAPQQPITRGQLAAILARALNLGEDDRFARIYYDIAPNDGLAPEIGGAIRAGLMMGYPDGTFRPNAPVTRQELAVVLSRMAERLNLRGAIDQEVAERLALMADWNQVAPWAQDGVRFAVAEGLMVGRSASAWAPLEQTTRAEAATVIQRLLDKVAPGEWR